MRSTEGERRRTGRAAKSITEMRLTAEARLERDVDERIVRAAQKILRPLDAERGQILVWRSAGRTSERPSKIESAEADFMGEILERHARLDAVADAIDDFPQIARRERTAIAIGSRLPSERST